MSQRLPQLGPRGEGWVALQFLLFASVAVAPLFGESWPESVQTATLVVGLLVAASGAILLGMGVRALGPAMTPLPRPRDGGGLRQDGILGRVRHPIYGGVVAIALGWSLMSSPIGLVAVALLAALLDLKSRREEAWLVERYPDYMTYRELTPRRFLPWLF